MKPVVTKFHADPPGVEKKKRKYVQTIKITWPIWPPHPYMVKNQLFKSLLQNQSANGLETWYSSTTRLLKG